MSNPEPQIVIATEIGLRIDVMSDVTRAIEAAYGSSGLILSEANVGVDFFDLRSGIAGELFQKCTNYEIPLALVVTDPALYGARVSELAFEHRRHHLIRFFDSVESALLWLGAR
jgi:Domain of unknown function (DUF4180)